MAMEPMIDYEALQQEAMRGLVRAVLQRVVKDDGLPGEHHFYISFLTRAPGVILSKRLKEKYPHEMTIVLQHRFWDLIVTEDRFEVKLTFDGIPERLVIPFAAIKVFIDPSVRYGLQFDDALTEREGAFVPQAQDAAFDHVGEAHAERPRPVIARKPRAPRKPKVEKEIGVASVGPAASLKADGSETTARQDVRSDDEGQAGDQASAPSDSGAQIFSFDKYKKK